MTAGQHLYHAKWVGRNRRKTRKRPANKPGVKQQHYKEYLALEQPMGDHGGKANGHGC
tara:strand:+ start:103 stop:276 length:174 start_codon:yes stop_codon:yes gene_type:complete